MTFPFVSGRLLLGSATLLTTLLSACNSGGDKNATASEGGATAAAGSVLTAGTWRGVLSAQGQEIPFLFDVATDGGKPTVTLRNGEERLKLDEITTAGDSTTIRLGVFDAALVVRADGADKLKGAWVKYDAKEPYRVAFSATKGEQPLFTDSGTEQGYKLATEVKDAMKELTYSVQFTDDQGESYPAVGIFNIGTIDSANKSTGTFLTTTGDYRYLAGNLVARNDGTHIMLSTFDGSHAFLFDGVTSKNPRLGEFKGHFYSGKSGHETWTAKGNPNAKLPDANALTGLKPGQKRLDFKFPSIMEGGSISPTDPKYQGKVVVVQVLGSWCPNCMDETNFLAPWYEQNKQRGVEIIGLGFERTPDQKLASQKLLKMKQRMNIGYDIAVAGVANKDSASKALPQLAKVLAFPTTIFLDKKGEVRKVHTGFSGPGTGKYYEQEKAEFEKTVAQLLAE
ncbi:TlpA family protein disulfide reductase [Hymenobacter jeollabukensis]|uniref:TlpA family protein disulfide reductase n=1 Tax=Hymenobacter jeollabukensis TaxID=2025313 RepID=A0A5R8WHN9_9BACT|nr:TlpA disulfide reductase family protein [Hymenobacter jeollabukensis]TLM88359.1 TlpA family protein disulfide reductase [Hymenobacter jeollabukensis]